MISIGFMFFLGFIVLMIASLWRIFEKAGEEGWKALIPIYNLVILLKIVGKPAWWIALMVLIPLANFILMIITYNMLAKSFGKGEGFTIGLVVFGFIFLPILAFSDAVYEGPYGDPEAFQAYRRRSGHGQFDFDHSL